MDTSYLPLLVGFIGVFGTLLGVLATAFSTEARTWLENKRLEKRQLKSTLFHQIELWGEIVALDKEIIAFYVETLNAAFKNFGLPAELTEAVFGEVPSRLIKTLEKVKAESAKDVLQRHEETIVKLSSIDPLLASDMSHRSRMRLPEQVDIFVSELNELATDKTGEAEKFVEYIIDWQSQKARQKMVASLEKGIVEIAWRINFRTWRQTKKLMETWRDKMKNEIKNEVHDYIVEVVNYSMKRSGAVIRDDVEVNSEIQ